MGSGWWRGQQARLGPDSKGGEGGERKTANGLSGSSYLEWGLPLRCVSSNRQRMWHDTSGDHGRLKDTDAWVAIEGDYLIMSESLNLFLQPNALGGMKTHTETQSWSYADQRGSTRSYARFILVDGGVSLRKRVPPPREGN